MRYASKPALCSSGVVLNRDPEKAPPAFHNPRSHPPPPLLVATPPLLIALRFRCRVLELRALRVKTRGDADLGFEGVVGRGPGGPILGYRGKAAMACSVRRHIHLLWSLISLHLRTAPIQKTIPLETARTPILNVGFKTAALQNAICERIR